ncbi:CDP-glycerol glycerophosphotransferase family protein [Shewanella seohaensis]|uniref:CDP-glycerol glycerophosphotransferase family protein n=1 Tax=Shewanella seohaensis TaxID=755175 RepID=UPI0021C91F2F|nr:CDP-glycerol glycerophosphotransferase family protein [Shewanella seohaensis]UXM80849.1 CDP-glycerol glycerophosphotransferase family protein [Shewanella seohaensis]
MGTNLALALVKKCIFALSWLVPRNANKAVLGCYKNRFADNSKYLFLHWQQTHFMQTIWISGDKALIHALRQQGYTAHSRWSLLGIYHALTAKYYVYNSYIGDINQWLAAGAIRINLWHGSPLKKSSLISPQAHWPPSIKPSPFGKLGCRRCVIIRNMSVRV